MTASASQKKKKKKKKKRSLDRVGGDVPSSRPIAHRLRAFLRVTFHFSLFTDHFLFLIMVRFFLCSLVTFCETLGAIRFARVLAWRSLP
jgi:hypothetical protein